MEEHDGGAGADLSGWRTVVVRVTANVFDSAVDLLWRHEPAAIEERADGAGAVLLAGYDDHLRAAAAAAALEEHGLGPAEVQVVEDDGLDGWRPFARAERAGPFVVVPTWIGDEANPGRVGPATSPDATAAGGETGAGTGTTEPDTGVVVHLDPGRTFGSGSHPTTRLVLEAVGGLVGAGSTVLDVGTGSGVLAVASALLGADAVEAIDVDRASPVVVAGNAARNAVEQVVHASTRSLAEVVGGGRRFDVVLANLLAPVIVELAPDLASALAPGGTLVVSGLLADRWETAVDHLTGSGPDPLAVVRVDEADGWVAVHLHR